MGRSFPADERAASVVRAKGASLVLSFLVFALAAQAFAQCDYRLQFSGPYRASIFDIYIDNNDLWAATGYGVQLLDPAGDPPQPVASVAIPGLTRVVRASNGIAYAAGTNGISVVQHSGNSLQLVRTVSSGVVNDLLLRPGVLFAATPAGIKEYSLADPLRPTLVETNFATSSPNVTSLAAIGSTLFVADGDTTIEQFSILVPASPQKLATLSSTLRVSTVKTLESRLYASDFQQTEVYLATGQSFGSVGTMPFPATSLTGSGSLIFLAGNDRRIRALDVTVPQSYVVLFDDELPPTAGTVNRVTAMLISGSKLYVAGGDSGLTTYSIGSFKAPFPLNAYASGAATSVVILPAAVYAGRPGTGIQELTRSSSDALVVARQWSPDVETVQDGAGFLLTSTGATLKFWALSPSIPSLISSATFRAAVSSAFLTGSIATVLLSDGSLWTADMSQATPVPVRVAATLGPIANLARSGNSTAATEVSSDGTTTVHFWTGDLNAPPVNTPIAGVSTALAISGSTIATFTFRGITVFNGATQTLLPASNTAVVTALQIANGKVIALTNQSTLRIWNIQTARFEKEFVIPGGAVAIDAAQDSNVVAIATTTGVATVNYGTSNALPSVIARSGSNTYYKKAAATADRAYLFDGRVIDIFELGSGAPRWLSSINATGVIDLAASDTMLFTLTGSQIINEYSKAGVLLRSASLSEGSDVTPLSIASVAGAPWISYSRGCTTTGCEKRTDVLDPQSLVRTATLPGGVIDVASNGGQAFALFDLPVETRVYDVRDALHPSVTATKVSDANAVAIAFADSSIYVLGDRLYIYSSSLTKTGEQLAPLTPASFADVAVDSGCAAISGRAANAETYSLPFWNSLPAINAPGTTRSISMSNGRLLILTDYSIEIWSRLTQTGKPKRHGVAP